MLRNLSLISFCTLLLVGLTGCRSRNYATATKEALRKMAEMERTLETIKQKEHVSGVTSRVDAIVAELEEIHAEREELPPFDEKERRKLEVKYAITTMIMIVRLDNEATRIAGMKAPGSGSIFAGVGRVRQLYMPRKMVFRIFEDPRLKSFLPKPDQGQGNGGP